jgi:formylglycine-generating enzyme required for sulfatase activity
MNPIETIAHNMIAIKGGNFRMGNNAQLREKPEHDVVVGDFALSKFLVTQTQWMAIMSENPSHFALSDQHPVDSVSWNMAQAFVHALNERTGLRYRLPRETEWEYAARGGQLSKGFQFPGSDELHSVAWYNGNSEFHTHPVGIKSPNELGLFDMSGNTWEWCLERVPRDYETPDRLPSWEENAGSNDRVLRGGSYINYAVFCRSTYRWIDRPDNVEPYLGLRLALG